MKAEIGFRFSKFSAAHQQCSISVVDTVICRVPVKSFLVVELSMGQMIEDVKLSIECSRPVELCCHTGGIIVDPEQVLGYIEKMAGGNR